MTENDSKNPPSMGIVDNSFLGQSSPYEDLNNIEITSLGQLKGNFPKEDWGDPDTEPPPPEHHGFLEQFAALCKSNIDELETVVAAGLTPHERMVVIRVAMKLLSLSVHGAKEGEFDSHPELVQELTDLALNLNNLQQ